MVESASKQHWSGSARVGRSAKEARSYFATTLLFCLLVPCARQPFAFWASLAVENDGWCPAETVEAPTRNRHTTHWLDREHTGPPGLCTVWHTSPDILKHLNILKPEDKLFFRVYMYTYGFTITLMITSGAGAVSERTRGSRRAKVCAN